MDVFSTFGQLVEAIKTFLNGLFSAFPFVPEFIIACIMFLLGLATWRIYKG